MNLLPCARNLVKRVKGISETIYLIEIPIPRDKIKISSACKFFLQKHEAPK